MDERRGTFFTLAGRYAACLLPLPFSPLFILSPPTLVEGLAWLDVEVGMEKIAWDTSKQAYICIRM